MTEDDLKAYFASVDKFADSDDFVARTCDRMSWRQKLRQGAIMASGGIGGLYALGQIVQMPKSHSATSIQALKSVSYTTDTSVRVGAELLESLQSMGMNGLENALRALNVMQSPHFFWISFAVSLIFLALYFAYAQEESF